MNAGAFLKSNNALSLLERYLSSTDVGIRLWAACFLLSVNEESSVKALEEISKRNDIHALDAETTLIVWRKGELKL